jgi:hypothetical protein
MRLSHIKPPQFGHFGELRTSRAGSNTLDAGIEAPIGNVETLHRPGSVSSRRLLKLSKKVRRKRSEPAHCEETFDLDA